MALHLGSDVTKDALKWQFRRFKAGARNLQHALATGRDPKNTPCDCDPNGKPAAKRKIHDNPPGDISTMAARALLWNIGFGRSRGKQKQCAPSELVDVHSFPLMLFFPFSLHIRLLSRASLIIFPMIMRLMVLQASPCVWLMAPLLLHCSTSSDR
ncbi:hypothetical protein BUE80_DR009007 [Diplocarpon rosae]|nr:hypothetical protein BUE80_DR009007 [Diplocarpon rosae]